MMITELIKKEMVANFSSPKIIITYIVCVFLVLIAIVNGAFNYLSSREEAIRLDASERDRLANIYNFQQDYIQEGIRLYRLPNVLSIMISGVEGDAARRATVTTFFRPFFDISKFNSTPILAIFGFIDLTFIVKIILSLFAILYTYDAISGEKEMGTLKLNLSNSVKRSSYLIGKFTGLMLLLITPFVISLLAGFLVIQFIEGIAFSNDDWIRTILVLLGFLLYISAFCSLGLMVSSLTRNPNISFLILLMLWVLFVAIVPRVAVLSAQNLEPVPSTDEILKDELKAWGPTNVEAFRRIDQETSEFRNEIRKRQPRPPIVRSGEAMREYERKMEEFSGWQRERSLQVNARVAEILNEAYNKVRLLSGEKIREQDLKQDKQNELAIVLSRFSSPAASLTLICHRLAKTGAFSSDKVFKDNINQIVDGFIDTNNKLLKEHPEYAGWNTTQTDPIDVSQHYPDVSMFGGESIEQSLGSIMLDYGVLIVFNLVFIAGAFIAFSRYDVR